VQFLSAQFSGYGCCVRGPGTMLAMCAMLQSPRLTMQALSGQEAFPVLPDPQGQPCLHTLHLGKFQRGGRAVAVPNSKIILFFGGAVDPWTYGSQVLRRGSLPLKNAFCVRHCGHPGHNAHTWPVLLAAAHPHACFRKACSSAMHTTAESVGQQGAHARAYTHTHTHTRTRAHTYTHAHMHAHVALTVLMGFANFSASLASLLHMSSSAILYFIFAHTFRVSICLSLR